MTRLRTALDYRWRRLCAFVWAWLGYLMDWRQPRLIREAWFIDRRYRAFGGYGDYHVRFLGRVLLTPWLPMLRVQLRAWFALREFHFNLPHDPVIVDAGGNLGIGAIWYWLTYRPRLLMVLEPDAHLFTGYLQPNLAAFAVSAVTMQAALWTDSDVVAFGGTGRDDGGIVPAGQASQSVAAFSLDHIISDIGPIDLLKLSIEGAETEVICCCQQLDKIGNVDILVNVSAPEYANSPDRILTKLREAGFRCSLRAYPREGSVVPSDVLGQKTGIVYHLYIKGTRH